MKNEIFKINSKRMNKYKLIYVNEKNVGINYDNVNSKNDRPYIFHRKRFLTNNVYLIPITDQFNDKGQRKNGNSWVEIELKKPSYIKLDSIREMSLRKFKKAIYNGSISIKSDLDKKIIKSIVNQIKKNNKAIRTQKNSKTTKTKIQKNSKTTKTKTQKKSK